MKIENDGRYGEMRVLRSIPTNVVRCKLRSSCITKQPYVHVCRRPLLTGCQSNQRPPRASSGLRKVSTSSHYFSSVNNEILPKNEKFPSIEDEKGAKHIVRQLNEAEVQLLAESLHEFNETRNDDVTYRQLSAVALGNFIPFVGFGFIDNVIMIFAGDFIDVKIGSYLGISIMAAAAMGNMVADIAGLSLAGYIETFSSKLGIVQANLTTKQHSYVSVKLFKYGGCIIGVMIGCLIGMFPLLLIGDR